MNDEAALIEKVLERFKSEAPEGALLAESADGWSLRTPAGRVRTFTEGTRIQALGAALAAAKELGVIRGE